MSIKKTFAKYVSLNIFGMIGISFYILADTFFISLAEGANGITALNLVLPIYSFIFAVGSMMGVGSAIRFSLCRAKGEDGASLFFSNAIFWGLILGAVFMVLGGCFPGELIELLGGNEEIVRIGTPYTRIFMLFAPFFMWNYVCNAFVRNDGAPTIAMAATLCSSLFNIVMDYILMFPLNMGMAGAALATAISPILGIAICCIHFFSKKNTIRFLWRRPSVTRLVRSCQLGVSAFVGEFATGVTTMVFNGLILGIAGNVGVAAYGVIANVSLVGIAVFNGLAQGSQPLFSELYGKGQKKAVRQVLRMSIITGFVLAGVILLATNLLDEQIVTVFNSGQDAQMAEYAMHGLHIYFLGFLFAGYNIVCTGYLSAVGVAKWAFAASILRGVAAIIPCAVLLSMALGMTGVWLAFPTAELITAVVSTIAIIRQKH
ncbi:MAG: MATE family efflux transporter [Lachnospiraceae bacterium]|nr:MATE family efflux transporter [Lachnospiraceae bacterium]